MRFFLYTIKGDSVKIYIDVLLIVNFFIDFMLLLCVGKILRRNYNTNRLLIGSFFGSFTIIFLFINISDICVILIKILSAVIINIIAFKFISIKYTIKNVIYFYMFSILLGGFMYILNIKNYTNFMINSVALLVLSPVILFFIILQFNKIRYEYPNYKTLFIVKEGKKYKYTAYMDTGNTLVDPLTLKKVILIDKRKLLFKCNNFRLIPYKSISTGLLKVIKVDYIIYNDKKYFDILIGIIDDISIDGADVILNRLLEG